MTIQIDADNLIYERRLKKQPGPISLVLYTSWSSKIGPIGVIGVRKNMFEIMIKKIIFPISGQTLGLYQ